MFKFTTGIILMLCLNGCEQSAVETPAVKSKQFISKYEASSDQTYVTGIDVSKYQGDIDFKAVKLSGLDFVLIRASEGNTIQDTDFKSHYEAAKASGFVVGAYHFYETNDKPIDQFNNFISIARLTVGDFAPVVDIEKLHHNDHEGLVENLKEFLNKLELHYGAKPIIYTGLNFANKYMHDFSAYPLWLAEYQVDAITMPKGWSDWAFWQWSQSGQISGVNGDVDENVCNGNHLDFKKILIASTR